MYTVSKLTETRESFINIYDAYYLHSYQKGDSTNMAVMEVELPSGYAADVESLPNIRNQGLGIKRVDTENDDTRVIVYFDRVRT